MEGDFVTIASTTDKNLKEYLSTKETVNGYSISNIQWSDQVGETKVTITKDGQFATLTFNEALLSQAIQNPVGQIVQAAAAGDPGSSNAESADAEFQMPIQRPMPVPQIPTPPPHMRPIIRRNATPQQPTQRQHIAGDPRRRLGPRRILALWFRDDVVRPKAREIDEAAEPEQRSTS